MLITLVGTKKNSIRASHDNMSLPNSHIPYNTRSSMFASCASTTIRLALDFQSEWRNLALTFSMILLIQARKLFTFSDMYSKNCAIRSRIFSANSTKRLYTWNDISLACSITSLIFVLSCLHNALRRFAISFGFVITSKFGLGIEAMAPSKWEMTCDQLLSEAMSRYWIGLGNPRRD